MVLLDLALLPGVLFGMERQKNSSSGEFTAEEAEDDDEE